MIWQSACSDSFKRSDDRAWAFVARRTCVGKMRQCFSCALQFSNARIERRYPLARQHTHLRPVSARIKVEQPLDLFKREARTLRRFDKTQPLCFVWAVAADAAVDARSASGWHRQKPAPLVKAHGFHAHTACLCQPPNCHVVHRLTPYYGTEAI